MANIRVTPETLNGQGDDLIKYAGELKDVLANVNTKIAEIIDGWDGLAQDAYFEMYETMKTSLDNFPELVNALGEATKGAAEAFEQVDSQLQGTFKQATE